ncbi:FAD-dependent oxidoreductase [Streptomyces sp. MB09-02B]|uniref:NAD(P)/FAD-dependent oxidoreductase n=1 Tax=Streptomyces sp. MB09-02B TaxID=3028667 RepID=UPI0029B0B4D4|nr:FAD-dependent oxidoreductase [Streptomyces sp. MB09-02B]MDX3641718.1 FAD-dependent oxidoreductase [Streptomyces sp. MB09-02B]
MSPDVLATSDIVVVGAGLAGLCTAFELRRRGFDVTVVEQRFPAFGASGRNPGCLWVQTRRSGVELAIARAAKAKYAEYADELGDVFEYRQLGGLFFFENEEQGRVLQDYVHDRRAAGVEIELLSVSRATKHAPMLPTTAIGAVYCAEDAQIDTQRFLGALSAAVIRSGVRLYENTAVLSVIRQGNRVDGVRTVRGDIRASGVVWATGAWTLNLTAEGIVLPVTTARMGQVVTQPVDQRPSAILHGPRGVANCSALTDLPSYEPSVFDHPHTRPALGTERLDYDDCLAQNRSGSLVIGAGIDGYGSLNPHISIASTEAMISTTLERYPDHAHLGVTGLWAGLTSDTADHLPIVDRLDTAHVNAGHSWGVASAPVAGQVLAELIAGEQNQFATALRADRPSLEAVRYQ